MKQLITEKDIPSLVGRFIVQLNHDYNEPDYSSVFKQNPGFWLEKRITFVGYLYGTDGYPDMKTSGKETFIINNGFYYTHGIFTPEKFVRYFNDYVFGDDPEKQESTKGKRYHRLLTDKELDWLTEELKKQK